MDNKKILDKNLVVAIALVCLFLGWYIYYNTSLIYLPINLAESQNITIGKYLKCAHEGERARANDNNADMPAYCCEGSHMEYSPSKNSTLTISGESGVCIK